MAAAGSGGGSSIVKAAAIRMGGRMAQLMMAGRLMAGLLIARCSRRIRRWRGRRIWWGNGMMMRMIRRNRLRGRRISEAAAVEAEAHNQHRHTPTRFRLAPE